MVTDFHRILFITVNGKLQGKKRFSDVNNDDCDVYIQSSTKTKQNDK